MADIKGTITLEGKVNDATLYVRLQDATMQDIGAPIIAATTLFNISYDSAADAPIAFSLPIPDLPGRRDYCVTAHLDLDGVGAELSAGDYITTISYPINPRNPAAQNIRLTRINPL
jgi:hypothetical protein